MNPQMETYMKSHHRLVLLSALLSVLLLTFVSVPLGQTPSPPSNGDYDVIKTDTNLITLTVSVTKKNRPILNLPAQDFEILDTGAIVKPQFFEDSGPTSIVFVIDTSTSMTGRKWHNLSSGLKDFLRKQPADSDYTLVVFSDKPSLVSQSLNAKQFWTTFTKIHPDGETALYDGLALGLDQLHCLTRHRKAIVLLSDGEDNQSSTSLAAIQQDIFAAHTTIFTVGILID